MMVWVFPSTDLHLLRAAPAANALQLRVFVQVPDTSTGAWTDASTIPSSKIIVGATAHAAPNGPTFPSTVTGAAGPAQTVTPSIGSANGAWMFALGVLQPGSGLTSVPIRVTAHDDVTALIAGDPSIHLYADAGDWQVTVFGRFADATVEDLTGHPYFKYTATPANLVDINQAEGRLTGKTAGSGNLAIATWDGRFSTTIPLVVRPALAGGLASAVVQALPARRTSKRLGTMYVVSEGYRDKVRFFDHANKVVNEWLRARPYNKLVDRFEAVGIYVEAPMRGITLGAPVDPPTAAPTKREPWAPARPAPATITVPPERLRNVDSLFGLMFGSRLSTPRGVSGIQAPWAEFFTPEEPRGTYVDPRRLPRFAVDTATSVTPTNPRDAFVAFVGKFLQACGQPTLTPDDRVLFLVDDEFYGGRRLMDVVGLPLDSQPMVVVAVGRLLGPFAITTTTAPILDRVVGTSTVDPILSGSVFAHELSHSYGLADEYENGRVSRYDIAAASIVDIDKNENVQCDQTLRTPSTPGSPNLRSAPPATLLVDRIKWNVPRITRVSPVTSMTGVTGGQRLVLPTGQAARWRVGDQAFLRNTVAVVKDMTAGPRYSIIAAPIAAVDATAGTVDVTIAATATIADVGPAPLLYLPKLKAGVPLSLIDPTVLAYLTAHRPFAKVGSCGASVPGQDNADQAPPTITGFTPPAIAARTIALYEGALDISCGIYRPTGKCKMRQIADTTGSTATLAMARSVVDFCFVCAYALVDRLDPSQHEWLDGSYP